jgi:hypothetical protein
MLGAGEAERKPEHSLIVLTDQFLESGAIAALRFTDQFRIVDPAGILPEHSSRSLGGNQS